MNLSYTLYFTYDKFIFYYEFNKCNLVRYNDYDEFIKSYTYNFF